MKQLQQIHARRGVKGSVQAGLAIAAIAALTACSQAPDLDGVKAENAKPVKRYDLMQSMARNSLVAAVGTQSGAVLVTRDQGKSWERQALPGVSLVDITACADGSLVGIDYYHRVWFTDAQASKWQSAVLDKPKVPLAVACDSKGGWWVVGTHAMIAASSDKGATWQVTDLKQDAQLTTIQFLSEQTAIATGEFGLVVRSEDGGKSWKQLSAMPNEFYPYATLFINEQEGWSSGIAGQFLHTTDGGMSWSKQSNPTQAPIYRLFAHQGKPYGVGAGGTVVRYQGGHWAPLNYPDPVPVFFGAGTSLPNQEGLLAGGPGGLLRVIGTKTN